MVFPSPAIVFANSGATINTTRQTMPNTNKSVITRLIGLAIFCKNLLLFAVLFPKTFSSIKCIGTFNTNAIAAPIKNGRIMFKKHLIVPYDHQNNNRKYDKPSDFPNGFFV